MKNKINSELREALKSVQKLLNKGESIQIYSSGTYKRATEYLVPAAETSVESADPVHTEVKVIITESARTHKNGSRIPASSFKKQTFFGGKSMNTLTKRNKDLYFETIGTLISIQGLVPYEIKQTSFGELHGFLLESLIEENTFYKVFSVPSRTRIILSQKFSKKNGRKNGKLIPEGKEIIIPSIVFSES